MKIGIFHELEEDECPDPEEENSKEDQIGSERGKVDRDESDAVEDKTSKLHDLDGSAGIQAQGNQAVVGMTRVPDVKGLAVE